MGEGYMTMDDGHYWHVKGKEDGVTSSKETIVVIYKRADNVSIIYNRNFYVNPYSRR